MNFPNQRGKSGTKNHFAIAELAANFANRTLLLVSVDYFRPSPFNLEPYSDAADDDDTADTKWFAIMHATVVVGAHFEASNR